MRLLHPLPPVLSRTLTIGVLVAWLVQMAILVRSVTLEMRSGSLVTDLDRYGSSAQWKGIYLRGEKIGFSVTQTIPVEDGYEIQEDGRLRMAILGMSTATKLRSSARVDPAFNLRSFTFSLDPGTGSVEVQGRIEGGVLDINYRTAAGTRHETRRLPEQAALSLNLPRRLLAAGLAVGKRFEMTLLDPVTLQNAPATIEVLKREVLYGAVLPIPTYRLRTQFLGMEATTWITDTGEVVREESGLGMLVVKEDPKTATTLGVTAAGRGDLLDAVSIVPRSRGQVRIADPESVQSLRLQIEGAGSLFSNPDIQGAGQTYSEGILDLVHPSTLKPEPRDPEAGRYLLPEPLVESDDPAIRAEAARAVGPARTPREKTERLVRHVHAIIEKRPTMSLPSATEVLRTRVGDCNEHTVLFVALARAAGVPARTAVGLVYLYGAFHYHAWAEVYLEGPAGQGFWLPVDPTLGQHPADATHIRLVRGGLDRQAVIMTAIGRIQIAILDVKLIPGTEAVLVGRAKEDMRPIDIPLPRRTGGALTCWGND